VNIRLIFNKTDVLKYVCPIDIINCYSIFFFIFLQFYLISSSFDYYFNIISHFSSCRTDLKHFLHLRMNYFLYKIFETINNSDSIIIKSRSLH
jgi:hypothetical protein